MNHTYDIVIIGSGPGGYVAAIRAAQQGARVALVEKDSLGGTCLNRGCIPTKAMLHDAEVYRNASSGAYCVDADSGFRVNFERLRQRKDEVVEAMVGGVQHLLDSNSVDLIYGQGRLAEPGRILISRDEGNADIGAKATIIATGSTPAKPPIPGRDLPGVLNSAELLKIEKLPESMVVIGGSTVGVEFACIFQALGTQVTILGRKSFLKDAEQQLAKRLRRMLSRRGMTIDIGITFNEIVPSDSGGLRVNYTRRGKSKWAEGEIVLLATGRWPYTQGLGLEDLGIEMNGRAIAVDEYLRTSVPGVYAIGDCIGGYMLAHVASYEAEVAVDNILGKRRKADYRVVPNCIFTVPEIADVGLTEARAKELGLAYTRSRFPFSVNGRALAMGETEGQVRMICENTGNGRGGQVLGVHIMGVHAGDLIAEAALAMRLGASAEEIARTIHAHPTVPEALMEAAMAQLDGAVHYERL